METRKVEARKQAMKKHLDGDTVLLLDGGIGTELERRGVPMSAQAWCGAAAADNVDTLAAIHRDYLDAGADIVTANTYAGARHLLELDGFGDRFEEINRAALRAARQAIEDCGRPDALIAGSLSHRGPIIAGTARPQPLDGPGLRAMADALKELAGLLVREGCDVILLEMMYDPERMPLAFDAAAKTGLPVWAGFSARRGPDGRVLGFGPDSDVPLEEIVAILGEYDVAAAGVMHTPSDLVSDALRIVRGAFEGPLLAYPDSGYFKSPSWQFEDVIAPEELRRFAEGWIADGVRVVGGCCGLSPEHIAALRPLRG